MNHELVVCTYCDQPSGMMHEYQTQLLSAGITGVIRHINPFPHPSSLPFSFKLHWIREFATSFERWRKLVFTDAFDVLFIGTRDQAMETIPDEVLWGAERNCFPEPHLAQVITGPTPWKYVNAGVMSGSPEAILDWVADAERHFPQEFAILDQEWLNRRLADSPGLINIDDTTRVFYVVSQDQEGGELKMKDGRPWNSLCDTYPLFFHFSGHCPTDDFRKMLAAYRM